MLEAFIILAHSWFDPYCCDGGDCKPETVIIEPRGYRLNDGTLIPHGDEKIKPSMDGLFYVCRPYGYVRCVYAPRPSGV